jgi:hypothetical protein
MICVFQVVDYSKALQHDWRRSLYIMKYGDGVIDADLNHQ